MFLRNIVCLIAMVGICHPLSAVVFNEYPPNMEPEYCKVDYIKIGGGAVSIGQTDGYIPMVGIGRRYECPECAIDYSAIIGYNKGMGGSNHSLIYYSIPKIVCLKFADPRANSSFYYGAGMSWSGIVNNHIHQYFHGVSGEITIGYETQRLACMRSFVQLDASQPILAAVRKGKFPSPALQLTFGLGF